jgi:hypothetical protein
MSIFNLPLSSVSLYTFSSLHKTSVSLSIVTLVVTMSGLEIAGLVISAISAGAGAISAFKDAKELNGSHHQMRQVTYTVSPAYCLTLNPVLS